MDEMKCPVCGKPLILPKAKSLYARCEECKLDYPAKLTRDLLDGVLPPYFDLTENSISVVNFALFPALISTFAFSCMALYIVNRPFNLMVLCIMVVGGLLMGDMFLKSFFRRFTIRRKDGKVIFSNGIGKLKMEQTFAEQQIKEVAIQLRKDRSVNHPVLVVDFYDNRRMLFGDGCPAFYIAAFYFWLKGRKLSVRKVGKDNA